MMRSHNGSLLWLFLFLFALSGCADSIDREIPPKGAIFSVTDMRLTADGTHLVVLSSNFKRAYDHGRVSLIDLEAGKVTDSLLVDSLGGRMALADDEKTLYVTTRESHSLHRISILHDALGGLSFMYAGGDGTGGTLAESTVALAKEPYAMTLGENDRLLLVTHMLNGEVTAFQRTEGSPDTQIGTFKMEKGISDIVADEQFGLFLTAHKSIAQLGVFRVTAETTGTQETPGTLSAAVSYLDLPLPMPGIDIRDIVPSAVLPSVYYLSYRNRDDEGYEYPAVLSITLVESAGRLTAERRWITALEGDLGEAATVPCGTEPGMELVFVASPSEHTVTVHSSFDGTLLARKELDGCDPYQLYSRADDPQRRLFIGCFTDDRILVMNADCASAERFTVAEVAP